MEIGDCRSHCAANSADNLLPAIHDEEGGHEQSPLESKSHD
jgi:hypothetical protein